MADVPEKPVYLLTGSDRPKIATALERLRRHFAPEAVELVSALEAAGEEVVALCNAGSLFGDARLVVVEDVDGRRDPEGRLRGGWKAADVDAVAAYLAGPAPATVLALVGDDVKKTAALWKACVKSGTVLEYAVERKKLASWVSDRFKQRGTEADPEACSALVQLVGDDLNALAVEVDKLATWAAGEPIGEREVAALVASVADLPVYELTDAWAARDTARVLDLSETLFVRDPRQRRDTAARLAGALGGHVARLRTIKKLAEEGVPSKDAASRLRLNAYYARRLYGQAEQLASEELQSAVVRLAALDGALKGQSKLAPDLEMQRALIDLTATRPAQGWSS